MTHLSRSRDSSAHPVGRTVWQTSAPPAEPCPPLASDVDVDVAVVGAGFVGLSAARHLAASGVSVAVLEQGEPGDGASGLNAGFVVPNFAKADPPSVRARLGEEAGTRLLRAVAASAAALFDTIRCGHLACEAEQVGWMQVAHDAAAAGMLRRRAALWGELGHPVRFVARDEARALTAARMCHGALIDPTGGMLNPLALARGLARLATAAGARVHGRTPVTGMRRAGDRWILDAGAHRVVARQVALCTNASETGVAAALGHSVVPLQVYQIATAPLPPDLARRLSPRRIPMADTRANLFTARLTADDRLVSGGMSTFPVAAEERMGRAIVARLAREFRLDAVPTVDFVWRGTAAMTPDFLPRLMRFGDGLYGAIGCNGRGVALTQLVGAELAGLLIDPDAPRAVPVTQGRALRWRALAPAAASLAVFQVRLKDALSVA